MDILSISQAGGAYMSKGYVALVLHAHLPFVRHPESETYLEERWLFEAISETYIPLLQVLLKLASERVSYRITFSLSPTLLTMLDDSLLQNRYNQYLLNMMELAEKEVKRTQGDTDFYPLALYYRQKLYDIYQFYHKCKKDLISVFRSLQNGGYLELITSAATHAFLPLLATEEAVRAQVVTGIEVYEHYFGCKPPGIWLPECGYFEKLENILSDLGIRYFITDTHGLINAEPVPVLGTLSPVLTPSGVAVFARDRSSSQQVWSSIDGYPGDFDYREFYRDIGFDLELETVKPYIHPEGIRVDTGFKYYLITGNGAEKAPYRLDWAREKAALHAKDFIMNRQKQVENALYHMGRKPMIVAPFDAELFGHWWYEGPQWIDFLLRKIHFDQDVLETVTPSQYLDFYDDFQECRLSMSSWGRGGYADVWLRGENDWIYPALHFAEERMVQMANRFWQPTAEERRVLQQAARELMLAQSSDWAFIMDNKTVVDYAVRRTKQHVSRFHQLCDMLASGTFSSDEVLPLETLDAIFPNIDYRHFQSKNKFLAKEKLEVKRLRVLVLSWEFPPLTIGGLSRHVYDLTRHLVQTGWEVHVVTTEVDSCPNEEKVDNVYVHRVRVQKPDGGSFLHWVFQLNLAMLETVSHLVQKGLSFDLVHAHDWLVCRTASAIKSLYNLPLIVTIHATEHGRNQGIHNDVQRHIHQLELRLVNEAEKVIVCSDAMRSEVRSLFGLEENRVQVLPNGIDPSLIQWDMHRKKFCEREDVVFFVGRLVREKGVHLLLHAASRLFVQFPKMRLVIAGQGPMREELEQLAIQLKIINRVSFLGFISDEERNQMYAKSKVAVFPSLYEPFGIVALEAMAAGTPVIATSVGGLRDVVQHEINGLTVFPDNVDSLHDQIAFLWSNPELAEQLSMNASLQIQKFNWDQIAKSTSDIYCEVLREWKGWVADESSNHGWWQRNEITSVDGAISQTNGAIIGASLY